jgi:hypothetical protein
MGLRSLYPLLQKFAIQHFERLAPSPDGRLSARIERETARSKFNLYESRKGDLLNHFLNLLFHLSRSYSGKEKSVSLVK